MLLLPEVTQNCDIHSMVISCQPPPLLSSNHDVGPSFREDPTSGETVVSIDIESAPYFRNIFVIRAKTIFKFLSGSCQKFIVPWSQWGYDTRTFLPKFVANTSPSIIATYTRGGATPPILCDFDTSCSIIRNVLTETSVELVTQETRIEDQTIWESPVATGMVYRRSELGYALKDTDRLWLGQDFVLIVRYADVGPMYRHVLFRLTVALSANVHAPA